MSNPKNNNDNLDDLFKKTDPGSFDDFEKDALEGFQNLGSEQEAHDLKAQLDKRIYNEVFIEKKTGLKIYWYAAAGLFLIIGFSVFFILNDNNVTKQNMAYTPKEEIKTIENKVAEESAKQTVSDEQNAITPEQKEILKSAPPTEKLERRNNSGSAEGKVLGPGAKAQFDKAPDGKENKPQPEKSNGDFAFAKDRNEKPADDITLSEAEKSPVVTKAKEKEQDQETPKLEVASNAPAFSDELKKEFRAEEKSKRKKESQKAVSTKKTANETVTEEIVNGNLADNRASGASNNNNSNNKDLDSKNREDDAKLAQTTVPASPTMEPKNSAGKFDKNITVNCYYSGGEDVLKKDLREKLTEKKLNKKFAVTLFINTNKVVEKVVFTSSDLTKDDELHIAEVLKTLTKFNVNPENKSVQEYKLNYRP